MPGLKQIFNYLDEYSLYYYSDSKLGNWLFVTYSVFAIKVNKIWTINSILGI